MSDIDSISMASSSNKGKGRLRKTLDSDEEKNEKNQKDQKNENDSIEISDQSELEIIEVTKVNKKKQKQQIEPKQKKPKQKKQKEITANQNNNSAEKQQKIKQVNQKKKIIESNVQTVQNLQNKKFIQGDEDDEPPRRDMEVEQYQDNNRDTFGMKQPKQQKQQKAKNINQLIKNRHKFFTEFEDIPTGFVEQQYQEEYDGDQFELKFESRLVEETAQKEKAKLDMLQKAQQYKQQLQIFQEKPNQIQLEQPLLKQTQSSMDNKTQEEKKEMIRRTFSMGIKKGLTQNDLDEGELQLFIPKINVAKDKLFENTLFLNKMKQKGFTRVIQTSTSLNNSQQPLSRSSFQQLLQQKQVEQRASKLNLTFSEIMNKFKPTSFEDIEAKKNQKLKQQNNNNDEDDSSPDEDFIPKQDELNESSEDIDDASSQQSKQFIDNQAQEDNKSENQIEKDEQKLIQNQNIEIIIEDIDDEEKQQLQELHKEQESQEQESEQEQQSQEESEQEQEDNQQEKSIEIDKDEINENDNEDDDEINQEDFKMFKRLKKVSQMFKERKQKEKELQEKQKQKLERQKERQKMKKFIESNLIDNQAEQGSDNESHDDVVKQINDNDEEEENDQIEKELLEMIDDKIVDLDEENEQRAFQIFMDRVHQQEKDQIQKILKGEFKRRNGKISQIDILGLEQTEEEKQAKLLHKYISSSEENNDDDSEFENYLKMNKNEKEEFIKEKRYQKILQAQKEMNLQLKKKLMEERDLFKPEFNKTIEQIQKNKLLKEQQRQNIKPITFRQSFLESKKLNENSNIDNSNSVSLLPGQRRETKQQIKNTCSLNRLFSANIVSNGILGQKISKSPTKPIILGRK